MTGRAIGLQETAGGTTLSGATHCGNICLAIVLMIPAVTVIPAVALVQRLTDFGDQGHELRWVLLVCCCLAQFPPVLGLILMHDPPPGHEMALPHKRTLKGECKRVSKVR